MPHELKDREIFAVGTWNGIEFTEEDLNDIAANFQKLFDSHKVPLKFGHNEEQEITDGQPAIGWVSRVYKNGKKLFADFSDLPRVVFDAIKNRLYRTVSIEVLFNVDGDGKRFNHVLDAVALLGADQPAVSSLADLDKLLAMRTEFSGGHRVSFETIAGKTEKFTSEVDMDEKGVQKLVDAAISPLNTRIDELSTENSQLKTDLKKAEDQVAVFKRDKADSEEKAQKGKIEASRKAVKAVLDAAVEAKSLTPAFRETYEKQIGFDDDERVVSIDVEEIKKMFSIKDTPKHTGLERDPDDGDVDLDNPDEQLLALTRQYQHKHGEKNFVTAQNAVFAANPKLHRAYLDSTGEV